LYETLAAGMIWWVGVWLLRRGARRGTTTVVVLSLLAVERFLVEFVRAKDDRFLAGLTLAQVLSLVALLVMGLLWKRLSNSYREQQLHKEVSR
jgi:prolipoprotein diacylglyceryltransferase